MADVFVSYKTEDRERVREIVLCLRHLGIDTWWDQDIAAGAPWDDTVAAQLNSCKCVVVVWSKLSVVAPWVKEEAGHGKARGVLAPVRIENVEPPIGFTLLQSADLRRWKGDPADPHFAKFADTVQKILRGERVDTLSAPFLQRRRSWIIGASFGAIALVAAGTLAIVMLDRPGEAELSAWESALSERSSAGYKAYLNDYPDGHFQPEARARLASCQITEDVRYVDWKSGTSSVQGGSGFLDSRAEAISAAGERAREMAEYLCNSEAKKANAVDVRTSTSLQGYRATCTHMDMSDTYTCNQVLFVNCSGRQAVATSSEVCQ